MIAEPIRLSRKPDKLMKVFEWIDERGVGVVSGWKMQTTQRTRLDAKLDMLVNAVVDPVTRQANLPPDMLAGPGFKGQPFIYKLKARGNVQLRPMLCLGPFDESDWTILHPAIEKDFELIPSDAADRAEDRRKVLLSDPRRRRLLVDDED
jgi:hypothetical protein